MRHGPWERMDAKRLAGFFAGVAAFVGLVLVSEPGFIPGLDHANLLFHEAGHPLTGLFSQRLEPYGGTVGQLFFPAFLIVRFWKRGQVRALAASAVWFFENFLNIARYLADARALKLPLVGGGDHDWNTILARWDILQYDTGIADGLIFFAWTGVGLVCLWVAFRTWHDRTRVPEASPVAGEA